MRPGADPDGWIDCCPALPALDAGVPSRHDGQPRTERVPSAFDAGQAQQAANAVNPTATATGFHDFIFTAPYSAPYACNNSVTSLGRVHANAMHRR